MNIVPFRFDFWLVNFANSEISLEVEDMNAFHG